VIFIEIIVGSGNVCYSPTITQLVDHRVQISLGILRVVAVQCRETA